MPHKTYFILASAFLISSTASYAATSTWTGASDDDWFNGGNWSPGVPATADTAEFSGAPTANQPFMNGGDAIRLIDFQSAGWQLNSDDGGSLVTIGLSLGTPTDGVTSAGAGVNILNANINTSSYGDGTNGSFNTGAGNTLVIGGSVNNSNRNWQTTGSGTVIFNGDVTNKNALYLNGTGSHLFNGSNKVTISTNNPGNTVVNSGSTFGGTSTIGVMQYTALTFLPGSTLSPGGNGATLAADGYDGGSKIATVTYSSSSSNRAGVTMDSGSFMAMDIGTSVGVSDQIVVGEFLTDGFALGGTTLSLYGGAVEDGLYTLMSTTVAGATISGSFASDVYFNDSILDPSNYTLNVSSSEVTIELTGIVPEPSTYALLFAAAVGAMAIIRRRK